jgi:hypothetical protein
VGIRRAAHREDAEKANPKSEPHATA